MDVLVELRDAIIQAKKIELGEDNSVTIDGVTRPGDTATAYKQAGKAGGVYKLASLVFAYLNRALAAAKYIPKTTERKLQIVSVAQRDHLVKYLEGKEEAGDSVDAQLQAPERGAAGGAATTVYPWAAPFDPVASLEAAMRNEVPVKTRYDVLDCGNKALKAEVFAHFFNVQASAQGGPPVQASAASGKRALPAASSAATVDDGRKRTRPGPSTDAVLAGFRGTPVILVPPTASSLINMHNAEDFFGRGVYTPSPPAGGERPSMVTITRTNGRGQSCRFHVTDNVKLLQPADWIKVVAVIAAGPEWQFSGWKWGHTAKREKDARTGATSVIEPEDIPPVKIFDRALGFHFYFEGDAPHPNAAKWAVTPLILSRNTRYADGGVANKFWSAVDADIVQRKPYLAPKPAA